MELRIADRQCRDQEGNLRRFHYFLTINQEETPHFSCENYGVRVAEEGGGEASVAAITTSATRIDELLTLLVDNRVGPAGLAIMIFDTV